MKYRALLCLVVLLTGGCINLSPSYTPPALSDSMPTQYKEEDGWKAAAPRDAFARGPWWEMFGDPQLNNLIARLNGANQNIAVAAANLRQARTQVSVARSGLLPVVSAPLSATRSGSEGAGPRTSTSYGVSAQWEVSFWNALPALEAAKASAEASAADYATVRLAMQAELAQTYFQVLILDGQISLYESTIAAYAKAVQLTRSQYRGGMVTPADVAQAESQLAGAEAQLAALQRQRATLEHGIALLVGQMPSSFALERGELLALLPEIPMALPSTLLERRPDIAAAERRTAAANEQIGMARAAWFPTISLGGSLLNQAAGWQTAPLYAWSVGPSAALNLFQGGKNVAENEAAHAAYEVQVASYRQTVLEALKDVEDNLSALRFLAIEAEAQNRAVMASQAALRLSMSQYRGGMTTYLQVVANQTAALTAERSAIDVRGQRLIASINLLKALGGGWQASDMKALAEGEDPPEGAARRPAEGNGT